MTEYTNLKISNDYQHKWLEKTTKTKSDGTAQYLQWWNRSGDT